ncbi:hypothetical protein SELMODRAFT_426106 [Selaginella moellendorffii]|uniref:Uncharacterized protein n=1 Tax=Selaginella moellendorffii TaxID=88036 RepID=D8SVB9_SELML|nr:hypothetical protein SELMODRAFT_426106 [Selaginella moellendorffii]
MEVFDKRPVVLIIIRMVLSHQVENFLLCSPPLRRQWEDAADASPRLEIHAMKQWPRVLQQTEWTSLNLFATKIDEVITFMRNMLSACSILYKMQLPFILTFNKTGWSSRRRKPRNSGLKRQADMDRLHEDIEQSKGGKEVLSTKSRKQEDKNEEDN